jgi:hypothetical protein
MNIVGYDVALSVSVGDVGGWMEEKEGKSSERAVFWQKRLRASAGGG